MFQKRQLFWVSLCASFKVSRFPSMGVPGHVLHAELHVVSHMQDTRTRSAERTQEEAARGAVGQKTSVIPAGSGMTSVTDVAEVTGSWSNPRDAAKSFQFPVARQRPL